MTFPFPSFIDGYMEFASNSEAPDHIHFWCAASVVSGALGRRTWLDLGNFDFTPNMYIILVAPPGVVAKSTTINTAVSLLREVEGIHWGPDMATPQSLLDYFSEAADFFEFEGKIHRHASVMIESSEFGNLFRNREDLLSNLLISLWDGKRGLFQKSTRMHGKQNLENPLLTIIGATTPSWIAHHITEQMISGGFISRCVFPYADQKQRLIAYPQGTGNSTRAVRERFREILIQKLREIRSYTGPFRMTREAMEFGEAWYSAHYSRIPIAYDSSRFSGYRERKQGHLHKLAMVLSAAESPSLTIETRHLQLADSMLSSLESDFEKVFTAVGRSATSVNADRLVAYVHLRGHVLLSEAHAAVHHLFPSSTTFADVLNGCIEAGYIAKQSNGRETWLYAGKRKPRTLVDNELAVTKDLMKLDLPLVSAGMGSGDGR